MPVEGVNVPATVKGVLPPLMVNVFAVPPLRVWDASIVADAILTSEPRVRVVAEVEARTYISPRLDTVPPKVMVWL